MTARLPLLAAGAWAAFNGLWYATDPGRGYRAESAWILFAIVLLATAVLTMMRGRGESAPGSTSSAHVTSPVGLVVFVVAALVLYGRVLTIGLLSDDFVLLARAQSGVIASTQWEYLRPLPLAAWQALSNLGQMANVALGLHALNVALHGVNAWLVLALAQKLGLSKQLSWLGAGLFLVFPASVETVVWASGIFDVLVTTWILLASLLVSSANNRHAPLLVALLTAAAVLTKETGVMLPALIAVVAWCGSQAALPRFRIVLGLSLGVIAVYVIIRITAGFAGAPPAEEVSGYAIKEVLSRPFGALAVPFHIDLLNAYRWVPFILALVWPILFMFGATRWSTPDARLVISLAGWIMLSIAPLATMFFVAPDLQGSRWIYLATVAWCVMTVVLLRSASSRAQLAIVMPLIVLYAAANFFHQSPWVAAGAERDRVVAAFEQSGLKCVPQPTAAVPDHISGAYVFRNGFPEAIAAELRLTDAPQCDVHWDGSHFSILSPR